jgi:hypothetical protein
MPRSSSASLIVSGGAMREHPPIPANAVMFIDRPSSKPRCVTAAPSSGAGFFESRSATISIPRSRPRLGTSAMQPCPPAQLGEAGAQPGAGRVGALGEAIAHDDLADLGADGGRQRVRDVGRVEEEAPLVGLLLDLVGRQHGGQRQAGAERLRQRQDVGHDAVTVAREHGAGAADAGLRLVQHQQHPPLATVGLEGGEEAQRELQDAAGREHRLGDQRRQPAGALAVDEVEGVVQLGEPVELAVGGDEAGPIGLRREHGHRADGRRTVTAASGRVRRPTGRTPVVSSSTFDSPGASPPGASARSITGCDSIPEKRWSRRRSREASGRGSSPSARW